jgi:hypothetical protein
MGRTKGSKNQPKQTDESKQINIEQIEQDRAGAGNSETAPAKKQGEQYTYWFFTWNNYPEQIEQIEQIEHVLRHECKWFVFQEEKGESGTKHLQGTLCLKQRQRLTQLKHIEQSIHWEPTKSIKASIEYCTKEETRNGRQWVHGIELPEPIHIEQPYGWQLDVMEIVNGPVDKRKIYWFHEPIGNVGKTTLCKYLVVRHNALMLTGKSSDMFNMILKYPGKRKLILVDCPRSQQDFVNYGAIEQIKNGLLFSGKYEGGQCVFNQPHVIVFANAEPKEEQMSMDRWDIREISPI